MPFVMFDVYTSQALGLNGNDAESLAVELDSRGQRELADRVRYCLSNNALVTLSESEREVLVSALDELGRNDAYEAEQVATLAGNLIARILGADLLPPPDLS